MVICNICNKFTIFNCSNCLEFCCWSCLSDFAPDNRGYWCKQCLNKLKNKSI